VFWRITVPSSSTPSSQRKVAAQEDISSLHRFWWQGLQEENTRIFPHDPVSGELIQPETHSSGPLSIATADHLHMKIILVIFLPNIRMTFNQVSRILPRHKIKSVGLLRKIACFLHPVEGWPGSEDTRCIQHNLMMQSGIQWTDHPVYRDQGEKTPLAHPPHKTQQVSNGRMVPTHNTKSVDLLPKKTASFLCPVNEILGLMMPDVHSIRHWCGQVQIRETAQSIENMVKEHHQHIHLRQSKCWW